MNTFLKYVYIKGYLYEDMVVCKMFKYGEVDMCN